MRKIALALAALIAAASFGVQGASAQMYGPGYGMGPGMMYGPGPGYGMGPGMMYGPGYGYGPMGPNMMYGPGYGMGPGMMYGPGYGRAWSGNRSNLNISSQYAKSYFERWLAINGNSRLKIGDVKEKDADSIIVDIVTKDNSLVQRFIVNRHTGAYEPEEG